MKFEINKINKNLLKICKANFFCPDRKQDEQFQRPLQVGSNLRDSCQLANLQHLQLLDHPCRNWTECHDQGPCSCRFICYLQLLCRRYLKKLHTSLASREKKSTF